MAVNPVLTGERRNQYTSSGSLGPYNFTFVIYADADIAVYVNDTLKILSTHYTVSTNANGTGSITFTAGNAPASGALVTLIGKKDISRTTRFTSGGPLTADALETEFNTNLALLQQLEEKISRAITLPIETDATRPLEFPYDNTEANNADRLLKFNSGGSGLELGPTTTNVDALAAIAADISTVAGISANVTAVAADEADIGIVATNITKVQTVADNINDVITVANDLNEAISEVETVANDLNEAVSEIDTVGNNIGVVQTVGDSTNIANITTVAGQISPTNNISTLAGLNAEISALYSNNSNITTIANDLSGTNTIGTVAADLSGSNTIGTVATNIVNVQDVASNIAGVNSFAERYRVGGTDPVISLDAGDLNFNTGSSELKYYDGANWQTVASQDQNVKVSATDTSASVLNSKIAVSGGLTKTITNPGSNEVLTLSAQAAEVYGFIKTDSNGDGILDQLQVVTTNGGADNINSATYASFTDIVYGASGMVWSINSDGELRVTI